MEATSKQSIEFCCFTRGLHLVDEVMYLDTGGIPSLYVDAASYPVKVVLPLRQAQQQHIHPLDDRQARKVFFGGVDRDKSVKAFRKMIDELGPVEQAWLAVSKETKLSRGFGFAIFRNSRTIDNFLGEDREAKYIQFNSGEMLDVKRAIPKAG